MIFGGETLYFSDLVPWFAKYGDDSPRLINHYGITETTVHSSFHRVTSDQLGQDESLIGRPLAGTGFLLLDDSLAAVSEGEIGELVVTGSAVSLGYLKRPELNRDRRDERGIPFVSAAEERDLYFAVGYAQATDRLWQMDALRRRARGRLAEIFGAAVVDEDVRARKLGIDRVRRRLRGAALRRSPGQPGGVRRRGRRGRTADATARRAPSGVPAAALPSRALDTAGLDRHRQTPWVRPRPEPRQRGVPRQAGPGTPRVRVGFRDTQVSRRRSGDHPHGPAGKDAGQGGHPRSVRSAAGLEGLARRAAVR
ncbi:hypothetical protein GCM10017771_80100 [Streptomyces capitiformicae]|uniref:AMP-dependent synthetase/ligase domain-containing protein n=1 Tax=Streptomyces capitiformicae TaxID=2014920 RepID=A0A918ZL74_9ACTN|nr:hypothetical protein GCM10017771_80100 [Streptomyces capitiformicae]